MRDLFSIAYTLAESTKIKVGTGDDKVLIPTVNATEATLNGLLNTVYFWAGATAVLVIVIAGFFYVTSRGEQANVTRAKGAILYASIGLVVILSAFVITQFVLGSAVAVE